MDDEIAGLEVATGAPFLADECFDHGPLCRLAAYHRPGKDVPSDAPDVIAQPWRHENDSRGGSRHYRGPTRDRFSLQQRHWDATIGVVPAAAGR